eukprot:ANDGO_06358.mRNA.1 hypothetical protein AURANDRAFT_23309
MARRAATEDPVVLYDIYEDYLDANISADDMKYLGDREVCRSLLEVGYRSLDMVSRAEFNTKKRELQTALQKKASGVSLDPDQVALAHSGAHLESFPLLSALADREELVRNGRLSCIIFIRDVDAKGHEVSGYIDYAHRLKQEDFGQYFHGHKKLLPKTTDLSFFNWDTQSMAHQSSPNWTVVAEGGVQGLMFKHKKDRKVVCVDPKTPPGDNSRRVVLESSEYIQAVIYDHVTRRKN